jgi:hypothetical protein
MARVLGQLHGMTGQRVMSLAVGIWHAIKWVKEPYSKGSLLNTIYGGSCL